MKYLIMLIFCLPIFIYGKDKNHDRSRDKVIVKEYRGCEKVVVKGHRGRDHVVVIKEREHRRHHHHSYREEEYREDDRPVIIERRTEVYRDPEPNPTLQFVVPIPTPPTIIITPGRH